MVGIEKVQICYGVISFEASRRSIFARRTWFPHCPTCKVIISRGIFKTLRHDRKGIRLDWQSTVSLPGPLITLGCSDEDLLNAYFYSNDKTTGSLKKALPELVGLGSVAFPFTEKQIKNVQNPHDRQQLCIPINHA